MPQSAPPVQVPNPPEGDKGNTAPRKPRGRLVELDILRGFLLVWMTLTHLPTNASLISNQTFGFVSGAEGFIFLAAFMVGQLQQRTERKLGQMGALRDISKRTLRVYLYHCGTLAIAFTVVAEIAVKFHRLGLQNLLSYYLATPKQAVVAAALLQYRPSLFDILPMYVIFMAVTPLARRIARRWSWDPVIYSSFLLWAVAQFGLRHWVYSQGYPFGLSVPENSTGAFDLFSWQLLWMVGLALGSIYADQIAGNVPDEDASDGKGFPRWLIRLSIVIALVFLILRYSPADKWMNPDVYGWLIDKWHLGPVRVINFSAIAIVLVRYGCSLARFRVFKPLAALGQASIEVFCVHILCCLAGHALSPDADPQLPWWQQTVLLAFTMAALFLTADARRRWVAKRKEDEHPTLKQAPSFSR